MCCMKIGGSLYETLKYMCEYHIAQTLEKLQVDIGMENRFDLVVESFQRR